MLAMLCFLLTQQCDLFIFATGCFLKHTRRKINQKRAKESKESVSRHPAKELLQDQSPFKVHSEAEEVANRR
jgi:hypothetical protein